MNVANIILFLTNTLTKPMNSKDSDMILREVLINLLQKAVNSTENTLDNDLVDPIIKVLKTKE